MVSVTDGPGFCESCDSANRTVQLAVWCGATVTRPVRASLCKACLLALLNGLRQWVQVVP